MPNTPFRSAAFLGLLTPFAGAQIDQEMLDRVTAEVVTAVEKATETKLGEVRIQLVKRESIAKLLAEENIALAHATKMSKAEARHFGRVQSRLLLAKFDWTGNRILICPDNFDWQSKAMKRPAMVKEPMFRAILVHECVHAADQIRYDWAKVLMARKTAKEIGAFTAVLEGNAQRLTAKICAAAGWSDGFEEYCSVLGQVAPNTSAADRLLLETQLANTFASYIEGRKFVEFLVGKLGEKAVAQAFEKPPADFATVLRPEWYLDPASRPAKLYDLVKPLEEFGKGYDKDWKQRKIEVSTPQLRAALALLAKDDIERVMAHLKYNQMLLLTQGKGADNKMLVAGLYEFDSPEEARFFVVASEALSRTKDEKLKQGNVRITDAAYTDLKPHGMQGMLFDKIVVAGGQKVRVITLVAARGSVCVELMHSNHPVEHASAITEAKALLKHSLAGQQEPKPGPDAKKKKMP